jgi:hypothetical protein
MVSPTLLKQYCPKPSKTVPEIANRLEWTAKKKKEVGNCSNEQDPDIHTPYQYSERFD